MNAKELVLNEFHSLIWFCHKNDYDSRKAEQHFYRFRGILWALRETGQISEEYRYSHSLSASKLDVYDLHFHQAVAELGKKPEKAADGSFFQVTVLS